MKQVCGSIFCAPTLLFQCCFCCLRLIHSSRFALVFRTCCPPDFLLLTHFLLASLVSQPSVPLPTWPLSWHVCLWVSHSFCSLIYTCCCSLLFHLLGVCCLKLGTLWVNCFLSPPLCLCIFLEMIIPNKLYIVLYYASAASHGAIAGLSQVSIKGYCICNHIKP